MHPCLQITELLDIIFRQLDEDPVFSACTLASLALTCRMFVEPALDVLWGRLTSFGPLITLFPEDAWWRIDTPSGKSFVTLLRPPESHEWDKFMRYAARVRHVVSSTPLQRVTEAHPPVYSILLDHRPTNHLFPNLKRIEWYFDHIFPEDSIAQLSLLLCPRVTNIATYALKVMPERLSKRLSDELMTFIIGHINIQYIKLYCPHIRSLVTLIPTVISQNKIIRTLDVLQAYPLALHRDVWLELSRLPMLEKTTIFADEFLGSDQEWKQLVNSSELIFPSLRQVSIHATDLEKCSRCMNAIQSPFLERLDISVTHAPTNQEVKVFFTNLAKRCANAPVQWLRFMSVVGCPRHDDSYVIDTDTLRILLSFRDVISCDIGFRCPVRADNAFLGDVAAAWAPTLQQLELGSSWRQRLDSPGVTLQGLLSLLAQCPLLGYLGLVFDPRVDEFKESYNAGLRPSRDVRGRNRLVKFSSGATTLRDLDDSDIVTLAGVLSDIIPSLASFQSLWIRDGPENLPGDEDPDDVDETEEWRRLIALHKEMSAIRTQERVWRMKAKAREAKAKAKAAKAKAKAKAV
ncbi:uncharacterized protein B0H18DRAFT_972814 [Fomitopsis serialis]|uniref:uncharacterized protein n=1 Tax=Fomitopsis serialis TaxID=139415 RepID=UPI0020089951|nr:uncharacterized protein B0H18DRAFT_972814 [Neoantrodia serialis]KAH9936201.1 hypothetical protein B0H18DRAFT_972814 [Neoantrodia serialis]